MAFSRDNGAPSHAVRSIAGLPSAEQVRIPIRNRKGSGMYKNLSPSAVGVFGRQSEFVEIALTHRFKGLEIDITEILKRAQSGNIRQACRYLCSASMAIGGFELPMQWAADEKQIQTELVRMGPLLETCTALGADRCYTTVRPTADQLPFHENFQFHVERLRQVADALAPANVKLGLSFLSAASDRTDGGFQFIYQPDSLLLLIDSVQRDNVGLLLDTWHWFVGGGDLEKLPKLRGEQVIGVRLADMPAGVDLANITNEQRLMPGDGGVIDAAAVLSVLDEIDFDGPVSVAPWPGLFKGQTRESIVSKASSVLDTLLTGVSGAKEVATAK
jgi:sugar phosphate isomerase/epimerase